MRHKSALESFYSVQRNVVYSLTNVTYSYTFVCACNVAKYNTSKCLSENVSRQQRKEGEGRVKLADSLKYYGITFEQFCFRLILYICMRGLEG